MDPSYKNLIQTSLIRYDKNMERYGKLLSKVAFYKLRSKNYVRYISFYDAKKKKLLSTKFQTLGLYDPKTNVWIWAWSVASLKKHTVVLSRKLLNYALNIDSDEDAAHTFLKQQILTSRIIIGNKLQFDIHMAVSLYITKQACVIAVKPNNKLNVFFKIQGDEDNDVNVFQEYILLEDIDE